MFKQKLKVMKKKFFNIFYLPQNILTELESPQWKEGGRCHNWKNYVDDDMKVIWSELTHKERTIIAYFADLQASQEEWD